MMTAKESPACGICGCTVVYLESEVNIQKGYCPATNRVKTVFWVECPCYATIVIRVK